MGKIPFKSISVLGSSSKKEHGRPLWYPGNTPPAHLDGSMPGDYGFDPLRLGSDPNSLKWFREAELQHSRWAMLGVVGILVGEIVRPDINFFKAPQQLKDSFPFPMPILLAVEFILFHYVEIRRWQGILFANKLFFGCLSFTLKVTCQNRFG